MACSKEKESQIREDMKEYYGKTIQNRDELLINNQELEAGGCREESKIKDQEAEALAMVHPDVKAKSYGCGLPVPELLEGCHVLDLGSGAGHDCFTLAKLVGETGHVTGVDMTEEQLDFARRYTDYHRETFGYSKPNTEFVRGYIENLGEAGLRDNTFDVIISNCTVNLSPDKKAVFGEAYRVLK
ncbi:Arsenite methyltransferase, partial [Branchiostoma belcheri]